MFAICDCDIASGDRIVDGKGRRLKMCVIMRCDMRLRYAISIYVVGCAGVNRTADGQSQYRVGEGQGVLEPSHICDMR